MKQFFFVLCTAILAISGCRGTAASQASAPSGGVENWLTNKNFVFIAETVIPQGGALRQLTTRYDLTVAKDTLFSQLPYFGRAFSAPMNPAQAGFTFTETNFDYKVSPNRRKGWEVEIRPKSVTDVRQMILSVFENGSASLRVLSINRQPISFNGTVRERPAR